MVIALFGLSAACGWMISGCVHLESLGRARPGPGRAGTSPDAYLDTGCHVALDSVADRNLKRIISHVLLGVPPVVGGVLRLILVNSCQELSMALSTPGQLCSGVAPRDAAESQAFADVPGALVQIAVDRP